MLMCMESVHVCCGWMQVAHEGMFLVGRCSWLAVVHGSLLFMVMKHSLFQLNALLEKG